MAQPPPLYPFWNDSQTDLLRKILENIAFEISSGGGSSIILVPPPANSTSPGTAGQVAYDSDYFYIAIANATWRRVPISDW